MTENSKYDTQDEWTTMFVVGGHDSAGKDRSEFENIVAVNKRYQQLNTNDTLQLISVSVLTSASYTRKGFMDNVFKKYFGETLAQELFGDRNNYFYNIDTQRIFQAEDNKGLCLDFLFTRVWKRESQPHFPNTNFIPGLVKENVWLVDDLLCHCESAKQFGFSALHNPTSTHGRDATMFYTKERAGVFQKMREIIGR